MINSNQEHNQKFTYPVFCWDETGDKTKPLFYRKSTDLFPDNSRKPLPSREGMNSLQCAASGQYNLEQLKQVYTVEEFKRLHVFDCREETHLFIDGKPVYWFDKKNAINQHCPDEIDAREQDKKSELIKAAQQGNPVAIYDIQDKTSAKIIEAKEEKVTFKEVKTEKEICESLGAQYYRIGVTDHHRPRDAIVQRFFEYYQALPQDALIYFHCRGGCGRATIFMVLHDIIKNHETVSFKDIIVRNALIGRKNLSEIKKRDPENSWKDELSRRRLEFVKQFYAYVKDNQGYGHQSWNDWLKEMPEQASNAPPYLPSGGPGHSKSQPTLKASPPSKNKHRLQI